MDPSNPQDAERTAWGHGPLLLALSVVAAVWMGLQRRSHSPAPAPPSHSAGALPDHAGVDGWAGTVGALHARLMPLHVDSARQRFDGRVLAERLGLEPGEPWRLIVTYLPREATGLEPIALRGWTVADARGEALHSIVPPLPAGGSADAAGVDPLRSLLSVPEQLEPGHEVSMVLWGRAPVASAERAPALMGLSSLSTSKPATLELSPRRFDAFTSQPSLARLERVHAVAPQTQAEHAPR